MEQITLGTKEFYEVMADFEKRNLVSGRYDKENKEMWSKKIYFQDGNVNFAFQMFLNGCNYGISCANQGGF